MFETVVLATDGSASVRRAIVTGLDLAARYDADVHVVSVVDVDEIETAPEALREQLREALESQAETALSTVRDRATEMGLEVTTACRSGRPAAALSAYAREVDGDLLVTGTRGRHGENRLLLGSVAERIVRTSPVPVLTVRHLENSA